jgi:hypothetical protein
MDRSRFLLLRCLRLGLSALVFVAGLATGDARPVSAATTLVVDDDGRATVSDCNAQQRTFSTIQAAVDSASPGSTILICPGAYAEQVAITKNDLTVCGAGQGSTIIRPGGVPATITGVLLPYVVAPIVLVDGATGVTISKLTVDGSVAESGASTLNCPLVGFYVGVHFRNASGTLDASQITKVNSGTRCSAGLRSEGVSSLVVNESLVDQSGNFGIVCIGQTVTCTVTGSTVKGRGSVTDQIQAGVNIRAGATATLVGNVIRDHTYALAQGVPSKSVGIFLVNADPNVNPHLLQDNTFINNDLDVQRVSTAAAL